ncbi:MAG: T9SS type A sorting domain-containing protein [Ferruginibacter sp.]
MNFKHLLFAFLLVSSFSSFAQTSNIAYAITGDGNSDYVWMNIRQVDLANGKVGNTIFQRSKTAFTLTDAKTKTTVTEAATANGNIFSNRDYPTTSFVAAAALDNRSNRLFFTPMRMNELRWVNLDIKKETPAFYTMQSDVLKFGDANDEANHITRMVIAADGNGYAITNDGNHLIKFTTARTPVITDLGNLVDAEKNEASVHNKCSSWGGDMIADAYGKLYIISASHHVFIVDISSRIATHKGVITGLPATYTTNGAAVSADGKIVVSSANSFEGYFQFTLDNLAAVKIEGSDVKYNASDLANGNLLFQKEADAARQNAFTSTIPVSRDIQQGDNKLFPNPVTDAVFNVVFENRKEGNYTIVLTDLAGRAIQSKTVNITKGTQTQTMKILSKPSKGMYMVKVLDEQKQVVFTEKLVIQ